MPPKNSGRKNCILVRIFKQQPNIEKASGVLLGYLGSICNIPTEDCKDFRNFDEFEINGVITVFILHRKRKFELLAELLAKDVRIEKPGILLTAPIDEPGPLSQEPIPDGSVGRTARWDGSVGRTARWDGSVGRTARSDGSVDKKHPKQERADYAEKHRVSDQDLQIFIDLPEIHQKWLQERKSFNTEYNEYISKKEELKQIQLATRIEKTNRISQCNAEKSEAKQTAEKENKERGYRRDILKLGTDASIKGFHITNSIKHFFTDEPTPNIKISVPRPKNKQHQPPDLKMINYGQHEKMNQEQWRCKDGKNHLYILKEKSQKKIFLQILF
ncbi:hypothetical protein BpHYR1_039263 [Brachionus plicatilis]|uniref:Uncharacterized protein n=1 Tax=Brachionus plicatilis TaxID=10195 RepID=A0A3M7SP74_BRAPC|nr:hypothetical protein BpHYR1_039263 [Brachionus plicatilis]